VATLIGQPADFAERDGMHRAPMVAQPQEAQRNALHGAADLPKFDVLADAEGILTQIEDARHDVADHGLRAEADCDVDFTRRTT
jgi:hypothetical protein